MKKNKVDIVINVYGKPWQTLCTLKTLMLHSGKHIDKIFLIRESEQPFNEDINWIFDFIYNAGELSEDYYKFVENTIFE